MPGRSWHPYRADIAMVFLCDGPGLTQPVGVGGWAREPSRAMPRMIGFSPALSARGRLGGCGVSEEAVDRFGEVQYQPAPRRGGG
jgi:hypothetical protein